MRNWNSHLRMLNDYHMNRSSFCRRSPPTTHSKRLKNMKLVVLADADLTRVLSDINTHENAREISQPENLETIWQDNYLTQYGLYRNNIIGDGNCFISYCLYGNKNQHIVLRNLVIRCCVIQQFKLLFKI